MRIETESEQQAVRRARTWMDVQLGKHRMEWPGGPWAGCDVEELAPDHNRFDILATLGGLSFNSRRR